jgi:hypothetical protein
MQQHSRCSIHHSHRSYSHRSYSHRYLRQPHACAAVTGHAPSAALPSSLPLGVRPLVHAKMEATELVPVGLPFWSLRQWRVTVPAAGGQGRAAGGQGPVSACMLVLWCRRWECWAASAAAAVDAGVMQTGLHTQQLSCRAARRPQCAAYVQLGRSTAQADRGPSTCTAAAAPPSCHQASPARWSSGPASRSPAPRYRSARRCRSSCTPTQSRRWT